jgi:tetratricopeptide (TPR) repeat protein
MTSGFRIKLSLVVGALLIALAPFAARAQDPAPTPEQKAQVKKLFAEGSKLYAKNKYREAIEVFKKAYAVWKNRKIMLNIAICHAELDENAEAVTKLKEALKGATPDQVKAIRAKMPRVLRKAEGKVAVLTVIMPDPRAEVFIDTQLAGRSPVEKVVDTGPHVVEVRLGGKVRAKKMITLSAGQKETWKLDTWPARAWSTPRPPGVRPEPKPAGKKKSFFKKYATLPFYYFVSAAAVTLIGGLTIIGTGVKAKEYKDDYYSNPTWNARNKGIKYRNATNAMVGITVAAGVAAGALAVFTDWKSFGRMFKKKEKSGAAFFLPTIGPNGAGVTFGSGF